MPLVRLLIDTDLGRAGETVKVNGQSASDLVREGRAELVREQRREQTSK